MMKACLWKCLAFSDDAVSLLECFKDEPHLFFLDSSQYDPQRGRYSFLGFDPFKVFVRKDKDLLSQLKEEFFLFANNDRVEFSPLISGMVGYLGYDYGRYHENIKPSTEDDLALPDCFFGFYDTVITIDHFTQKLYIASSGLPERKPDLRQIRALSRLDYVSKKLDNYFSDPTKRMDPPFPSSPAEHDELPFKCNFSKEQYLKAVRKALDYIAAGDIYQVNLSQRFEFDPNGGYVHPLEIYKALRHFSPTPFGGYLDCGDFQIISNSPERFLHLKDNVVETRPMKGTRPRGANDTEDRALKEEMIHSRKEKAELLMITDLERNDLGRVCEFGSVHVKEMRSIEEYQTVFQATSTIGGRLANDKNVFDLIQACFPGGSITGCPKIRAMQIIEELEPTKRAVYTGSMGYISFCGDMDLNILIRTMLSHRGKWYFQVGGGVVSDSTPEDEYKETLIKASAMRKCLEHMYCPDVPASKI